MRTDLHVVQGHNDLVVRRRESSGNADADDAGRAIAVHGGGHSSLSGSGQIVELHGSGGGGERSVHVGSTVGGGNELGLVDGQSAIVNGGSDDLVVTSNNGVNDVRVGLSGVLAVSVDLESGALGAIPDNDDIVVGEGVGQSSSLAINNELGRLIGGEVLTSGHAQQVVIELAASFTGDNIDVRGLARVSVGVIIVKSDLSIVGVVSNGLSGEQAVLGLHQIQAVGSSNDLADPTGMSSVIAGDAIEEVVVSDSQRNINTVHEAVDGPVTSGGVIGVVVVAGIVEQTLSLSGVGSSDDVDVICNTVIVQVNIVDFTLDIVADGVDTGDGLIGEGNGIAIAGANQEDGGAVGEQLAIVQSISTNRDIQAAKSLLGGSGDCGAIDSGGCASAITGDLDSGNSAVSLSGELEQVASNDIAAISVGLGGLNIIVGIAIRGNIELTRSLLSTSDGHDVAVDDGVGGSTNSGVIGLTRLRSGVDSDLADGDLAGGAIHVGDIRGSNASAVSSVADPPDAVDDTVAVGSSDISSTDQAAILVEEPGVVLGGVASLIEDELDSIIIDSASNIVLLVVPVDDGLSAGEGLGLSDDLAIVISALGASVSDSAADLGIVGRQGVGVQQNVITLDVGVVILAVGEGQFLVGSAIINEEGMLASLRRWP